jgi:hypothetical protein
MAWARGWSSNLCDLDPRVFTDGAREAFIGRVEWRLEGLCYRHIRGIIC